MCAVAQSATPALMFAVLLLAAPDPVDANDQSRTSPGTQFPEFSLPRAKVLLTDGRSLAEGKVLVRRDSLEYDVLSQVAYDGRVVEPAGPSMLRLSLNEVDRIEVPDGDYTTVAVVLGFAAGTGLGLLIWGPDTWEFSLLTFGLGGAAVGAAVGSNIDRWETAYESRHAPATTTP